MFIIQTSVANTGDAEDLFQECLIAFWKSICRGSYKPGNPKGYFAISVRNKIIDYIRSKRNRNEVVSSELIDLEVFNWLKTEPENNYDLQVLEKRVDQYIDSLKDSRHKKIFRLRSEGVKFKDIARQAGVPESTTRGLMSRMRKEFKLVA